MTTFMVTGARGFVGRALVKHLLQGNHAVVQIASSECDLTDPSSVDYLLRNDVDYVFHLAGKVGVPESFQDPNAFYRANVDTTRHVLEYCRIKKKPMHFVSGYVYGVQAVLPISESVSPKPNNPYAHSKLMAESLCAFYHEQFHVPVTVSRPFNIYGIDNKSKMFIPSLYRQLKSGSDVVVNDLNPMRDYVYIDDVVAAMVSIMEKGKVGEIYNIGTGISHSCGIVIDTLQSLMNTQKPVISTNVSRMAEIMDVRADITKIKNHTGWAPAFSLQRGLRAMLGEPDV